MTTTSADIFSSRAGVSMSDTDDQARRAVKAFRALQPTLTAYARVLTKRRDVRVEMSVSNNGATDGTKIYYRPPMALGEQVSHERRLCEKRDENGIPSCRACANREDTLVTIYHEIAHICFDSFAQTTEEDRARLIEEAVKEAGGKYAEKIAARIDSAPRYVKDSYIGMSSLVSQYLPLLVNALEDARVNRELFKARKGTKVMFGANTSKIFREGVEQVDPSTGKLKTIMWNKYPLDTQALVGVFCKASGYEYSTWFAPEVVVALDDAELTRLVNRISTVRSASGVYNLSFPVLARLRDLGFCKLPDDPEPEAPEDGDTDEQTDSGQSDSEPESGESDGDNAAPLGSGPGDSDSPESSEESEGDPSEGEPAGEADPEQVDRGDGGEGEESGGPADGDDASSDPGPVGEDADAADASDPGTGSAANASDSGDPSGEVSEDGSSGSDDDRDTDEGGAESGSTGSDLDSDAEGSVDDNDSGSSVSGVDDKEDGSSEDDGTPGDEELGDEAGITGTGDAGKDQALGEGTGGDLDADTGGEREDREGTDGDSVGSGEHVDSDGGSDASETDAPDSSDGSEPNLAPDAGGTPGDQEGSISPLDDDELIDTGADDGTGGVTVQESEDEPKLEYGTPDDAKAALLKWGDHEEKPTSAQQASDDSALEKAIVQGIYFETPSSTIRGVREHRYGVPQLDEHGHNFSRAWDDVYSYLGYSRHSVGRDADLKPSESIMGPALLRMRVAFADNARGKIEGNRRSGRVNGKVLGKRAPLEDGRLFRKKSLPGKKSYFVLIGMDVSGSTVGTNIALEKAAVMAQATLCARMGIDFAVYAHSGNHHNSRNSAEGMDLDIYMIKEPHESWDEKVQKRLEELGPDAGNIDGHTLEYFRKVLDTRSETDKIILYYSDGKMPAENYDEEIVILQRELRVCKQKGYTVLGVGIRTDSPVKHGLDTVRVDAPEDVSKVVRHLEKRLLG